MIREIKQKGCSKRDWSDQFFSNLKRARDLLKEHEDFIDKARFDIWVLHFCPEHGELLYKTVSQCDFYDEQKLKPNAVMNDKLVEAIKMVKQTKSEAAKQQKSSQKDQNKSNNNGNKNNNNNNLNRNNNKQFYQNGGGRGSYNSSRNNYYQPYNSYSQRYHQTYGQPYSSSGMPAPMFRQPYHHMQQYTPSGFLPPKPDGNP